MSRWLKPAGRPLGERSSPKCALSNVPQGKGCWLPCGDGSPHIRGDAVIIKPNHTIYQTTVLEADPDSVWAEVRDVLKLVKILFGDTVGNMHWVADGSPERVPSRYEFTMLHNQSLVQQEVVGRNETARTVTYRTVAPMPCLYDYVATHRILPVTNEPGRSFMEYSREFMVTDEAAPEIVESLMAMMDNQITVVRDYFATPKPISGSNPR